MNTKKKTMHFILNSDLKELKKIEKICGGIANEMGLSENQKDNLSIAFTEAVGNAITHGNKMDRDKKVEIDVAVYEDRVCVSVKDEGTGFDPAGLDDPLDPKNLLKESGRGIFILKTLMDETSFSFEEGGTAIHFTMIREDTES